MMLSGSDGAEQQGKSVSIIGGMFGLEDALCQQERNPPFLTNRDVHLVNGRCGIWLLVDLLRPRQVWVPSYLCRQGILEGIDQNLTVLRYYEIDYDLKIRSNQWVSEVLSGDLVIFIDYFGFPYNRKYAVEVKEKGAWVLEDACQALLSELVGESSDFVLFNIVKWIGAPDGAVLRFPKNVPHDNICLDAPAIDWWLTALQASVLRREFDDGLPTQERWFKLFRETEDTMPLGPYAMSQLSQTIMRYAVDYSKVAEKRIDNYCVLLEQLAEFAIFPRIETGVVPLGFPVRVTKRDRIRNTLFEHRIYPPVHWLIDGVVPNKYTDSHRLARQIMTLPCDHRYSREDMKRMAKVFLKCSPQQE